MFCVLSIDAAYLLRFECWPCFRKRCNEFRTPVIYAVARSSECLIRVPLNSSTARPFMGPYQRVAVPQRIMRRGGPSWIVSSAIMKSWSETSRSSAGSALRASCGVLHITFQSSLVWHMRVIDLVSSQRTDTSSRVSR